MSEQDTPRFGIDPYLDWIANEGLIVHEDYGIYLTDVETAMWPRFGVPGAAIHCKGRGDFATMFLFDLPPGGATEPMQHLFEKVVYVLEGTGSTQLEFEDGSKRSFEWGQGAMFAIPLNAKYRHFNGSGQTRARIVGTTNMPLIMNTFFNDEFIFNTKFAFKERLGKEEYFDGQGDLHKVSAGKNMWETNFVPNLNDLELLPWGERGQGSSNIMFVMANGLMHAHMSEVAVGTYKKAHKHMAGTHVMVVSGQGYSLMWFEDQQDYLRIDWKHGLAFPPAEKQMHQHFNTGGKPARYFATGVGSLKYPLLTAKRRTAGTLNDGKKAAVSLSTKLGGDQIEYHEQDPYIHSLYKKELAASGVELVLEDSKIPVLEGVEV
jgi:quercetin dioxygenase-like cupin family protein